MLVTFLALPQEVGVIAGVSDQLLVRDLVNLLHHFIHELAIMRNQQQRAGVVLQIILQPKKRQQVEMIGRFVEQQQIRLHHEQSRQIGRA